jgi:uncharacterized protein YkwD
MTESEEQEIQEAIKLFRIAVSMAKNYYLTHTAPDEKSGILDAYTQGYIDGVKGNNYDMDNS